ncbi:MAG: tetratricopeptide repeat protein [Acidobacteria bacterium]|nr:tetratricopeptide repeat protein [Acidobacteriota bacterium]
MNKNNTILISLLCWAISGWAQTLPITTHSAEAKTAYEQGLQYQDHAQTALAKKAFEKALKADPHCLMAEFQVATFSPQSEFRTVMQKIREKVDAANLSEGERLYLAIQFANQDGNFQEGQAKTQELAQLFPKDPRVQLPAAFLFYFNGQLKEAIEKFEQIQQMDPSYVPVYNILGYAYKDSGNLEKADWAFKRSIQLNPENPNVYDSYGEFLLKRGQFEESISYYEKAIKTDPLFPSAVMGIASNYLHLNQFENAQARLDAALSIAPDDQIKSGIFWAKAVVYADQGKWDKSIQALNANLELSIQNGNAIIISRDRSDLARLLAEAGQWDQAEKTLRLAIKDVSESNIQANFIELRCQAHTADLATLFAMQGQFEKAQALQSEFMTWAEASGQGFMIQQGHEIQGLIDLGKGNYAGAVQALEQATTGDAYVMYRLALAYQGLGNRQKAHEMANYVWTYRGNLNFRYSFVRHRAKQLLADLKS